jgi:hypothetical protein
VQIENLTQSLGAHEDAQRGEEKNKQKKKERK